MAFLTLPNRLLKLMSTERRFSVLSKRLPRFRSKLTKKRKLRAKPPRQVEMIWASKTWTSLARK